jgi:hypothetical protein
VDDDEVMMVKKALKRAADLLMGGCGVVQIKNLKEEGQGH